jgi:hypothetical protein
MRVHRAMLAPRFSSDLRNQSEPDRVGPDWTNVQI